MQKFLQLLAAAPTRLGRWGFLGSLGLMLMAVPAVTQAQTIYGLGTITGPNFRNAPVGSQGLIIIDPNTGASTNLAPVAISGVTAGQTLMGIDFRPATNVLYALGYDGNAAGNNAQLYTLDPGTSAVTAVGGAIRLNLGGTAERIGFDFNPTVDRIRVVSSNNANYRLNPITGGVAATDPNVAYVGGTPADPGVGAVAYTNSYVGAPPASTTLYDVDYLNNGLLSTQDPATGALTTRSTIQFVITGGSSPGTYPIGNPDALGLDIYYNPNTNQNVGYLTEVTEVRSSGSRASNTYRLDLATGLATQLGNTVPSTTFPVRFNFEIRDLAVAIATIPTITWNGLLSTDWRNALNWTPNIVPGPPNDVIIPGSTPFQPTVSQAQQTHALTLGNGAVVTLADGSFLVTGGNFTNNGGSLAETGAGTGTVVLDLNTPQTIGGTSPTVFPNLTIGTGTAALGTAATLNAPASVRRLLTLFGDLTVTGQTFTLLSDATATAQVVNTGGMVVGAATVQRYITPTFNGTGYRHYSPPVSGSTVNDLTTAGYTPVINPSFNTVGKSVRPFPTVYSYDERRVNSSGSAGTIDFDKGYLSPNSLSDALNPTQGYTVNISAAANVDFVGTLNNGNYTAGNLTRGPFTDAGWHFRGNPYPAPLDWQAMINAGRLTNMENALYVFKSNGLYTGTYASYINGVGANGGTNIIPSSQGFCVRTIAAGQVGSIAFTNAERLSTYNNTPFQRGTADTRTQLTLSLRNATAATQTAIYFDQGATAGFDAAFDAVALPSSNGLTLATDADGQTASINGLPTLAGAADVVLPLYLSAATAGTYSLAVDNLANLPAGYHAYLRDALTGAYIDLATTPTISLTLAANAAAAGRYAVLFTTQARVLATAPAALARLASVYPNPAHGSATLLLPVALRGTVATAVTVVDNLGRPVLSRTLAAGTAETLDLPLAGLAPGVYSVQARTAAGLVAKRLVVQ
ncbi:DUF4394 domain-containing protein [Microvirga sp. STS02]|uniref:DUF4394 domain-containing protein n=1 Tax=Hymenobacter negativus TaxID=2795026 RepID=UPI0018DDA2C2|nr:MULTISPECIES: DUF4394 domain-containing protein [Bacteria]MBH8567641.1 DUF4394 domain-containing protein [Hymenobacter negativus]MBR7207375.1 DUF4394 domain-containing protein [Microvirga sp. STS02]